MYGYIEQNATESNCQNLKSNALMNVTRRPIGKCDNLRQYILRHIVANSTQLSNVTIKMGITCTIFDIFIWGGISSEIRSGITFCGSARASP